MKMKTARDQTINANVVHPSTPESPYVVRMKLSHAVCATPLVRESSLAPSIRGIPFPRTNACDALDAGDHFHYHSPQDVDSIRFAPSRKRSADQPRLT